VRHILVVAGDTQQLIAEAVSLLERLRRDCRELAAVRAAAAATVEEAYRIRALADAALAAAAALVTPPP
jgi:hypothetical protein